MSPSLRKLSLSAHVTTSVGWLGALAGFLVLSIAGLVSRDPDAVRASYVSMSLIGQFAIVPLSIAALTTGLVQAIGTPWGLMRYYWVATKLGLTIFATIALVLHQLTAVVEAARRASITAVGTLPELERLGVQLVVDASLGIVVLIVITTLSVYKPWGKTSYGRRADRATSAAELTEPDRPLSLKIFVGVIAALVAAFLIAHLAGKGFHHH